MTRRRLLGGLTAVVLAPGAGGAADGGDGPIVSLDYSLASTLLSLGIAPAGVASLADWDRWVVEPAMPAATVDLGSSWEVNLEVLVRLRPSLILITPYLEAQRPQLERIAPVASFSVYVNDAGNVLDRAIVATRDLARRVGREREADAFLMETQAAFDGFATRLQAISAPPLALVSLMDTRHARIYGGAGLYQSVMTRIGLKNAWKGSSNYWGFETIGIEDLSKLEDSDTLRLIAFEPLPADVLPKLSESRLWTSLPFVAAGRVSTLPPVLMFGMVTDALRFARLVTTHLEEVHA